MGLAAALGLAAACGFRVFVPLLVASLAARADLISVNDGFAWLASTPALTAFAAATVLEIAAYYVPVVDNLLDAISTPAAAVAGTLLAAAVIVDIDPWLRWTLAVIAGAGAATAVQLPTVALRGTSTAATAGTANPIVSTGEAAGSTALAGMAVLAPVAIPLLLVLLFVWIGRRRRRLRGATV